MRTDEIVMSCHLLYDKKQKDYRVVVVCYDESIEMHLKENECEVGMTSISVEYADRSIVELFGEFGHEKTCGFIADMMIRAIDELQALCELMSIDKNAQPSEHKTLYSDEFAPLFDYLRVNHDFAYAANFCLTLMEAGMYMLPWVRKGTEPK